MDDIKGLTPHASRVNGTVPVATIPWRFTYLCWKSPFLVGREAGTLVQDRSDLALELADRPVSVKTFRFVKGPFERIVDTDQFDEMRPGEP